MTSPTLVFPKVGLTPVGRIRVGWSQAARPPLSQSDAEFDRTEFA